MTTTAGAVSTIWRFPVKSMGGERLEEGAFERGGLLGDRAYGLVDVATGKVVSAKSVRLFPDLLRCRAAFVEAPRPGAALPPVRITLPDGGEVRSDGGEVDAVLSRHFGRALRLSSAAPDDFTIDQYHSEVVDADPSGVLDAVVDQKLGAAYYAAAGVRSPVPAHSFFDLYPISVLTTSTLAELAQAHPSSRFDERRFRMNLVLHTGETGFVENGWVGRELAIGRSLRLSVSLRDPRCVMTTLAQEELPRDSDILRAMVQLNRVSLGGADRYPCAGVYAEVLEPGVVRSGDPISLV